MRILRPEEINLLRLGLPVIPANGGSSKSSSDTSTTNNTTNHVTSTDKRSVASEEAVSVSGDGNYTDRSSTSNTSFSDSSNRSTNFSDSSNRSTNFSDSSQRDSNNVSNTSITTTDFGSIAKSLEGMGAVSTKALDFTGLLSQSAFDSVNKSGANSVTLALRALDTAQAQSANAITSARDVLGFAREAVGVTNEAFATAKDGGTSKAIMAAAVVIGIVGVAAAMR